MKLEACLKPVLGASWTTQQLVLANFARSILDAARAGLKGVGRGDFGEFLYRFMSKI